MESHHFGALNGKIGLMKEQFLHFVWQYRRFNHSGLSTTDGLSVEILKPGKLNLHDGPDFLNALIRIGDTVWAGHVEIHVKSSDWIKHGHSGDPMYNNVVLHVVYQNDLESNIAGCQTLELCGLIPRSIYNRYLDLMESPEILPCRHLLKEADLSTLNMWKERLLVERMERKVSNIQALLEYYRQDWEQVSFIWLMRYFGSGINMDSFQELGDRIPVTNIRKIADDPDQIAALLFGTAGMLNDQWIDLYPLQLKQQFEFLSHRWKIHAMPLTSWKWKHTRPATFPSIRLAQLAAVLPLLFPLFEKLHSPQDLETLLTGVSPHDYWDTHYRFDEPSPLKNKPLTKDFIHHLQINVSIPLMLAYARYTDDSALMQDALSFMHTLPRENNRYTRVMSENGLANEHAADSQSLMELKTSYCDRKQCLKCNIGNKILQPKDNNEGKPVLLLEEDAAYI